MVNEQLLRFESIGENCEFGFFQRRNNIEVSSLFRWAFIYNYARLVELIKSDFQDLFLFENLVPAWRDAVKDTKYEICFHSIMTSHKQAEGEYVWDFDETGNLEKYESEKGKIAHLVEKFRASLRNDNRIFIVKRQGGAALGFAYEFAGILPFYSKAKILCVEKTEIAAQWGKICQITDNLYSAFIDRFPPDSYADDLSTMWWPLIDNALSAMPEYRPARRNRLLSCFSKRPALAG